MNFELNRRMINCPCVDIYIPDEKHIKRIIMEKEGKDRLMGNGKEVGNGKGGGVEGRKGRLERGERARGGRKGRGGGWE